MAAHGAATEALSTMVPKEGMVQIHTTQRSILERIQGTNAKLEAFNDEANLQLETTMRAFREHTEVLSEARKDLHSIFRRLRLLHAKLQDTNPDAFAVASEKAQERARARDEEEEAAFAATEATDHKAESVVPHMPGPVPKAAPAAVAAVAGVQSLGAVEAAAAGVVEDSTEESAVPEESTRKAEPTAVREVEGAASQESSAAQEESTAREETTTPEEKAAPETNAASEDNAASEEIAAFEENAASEESAASEERLASRDRQAAQIIAAHMETRASERASSAASADEETQSAPSRDASPSQRESEMDPGQNGAAALSVLDEYEPEVAAVKPASSVDTPTEIAAAAETSAEPAFGTATGQATEAHLLVAAQYVRDGPDTEAGADGDSNGGALANPNADAHVAYLNGGAATDSSTDVLVEPVAETDAATVTEAPTDGETTLTAVDELSMSPPATSSDRLASAPSDTSQLTPTANDEDMRAVLETQKAESTVEDATTPSEMPAVESATLSSGTPAVPAAQDASEAAAVETASDSTTAAAAPSATTQSAQTKSKKKKKKKAVAVDTLRPKAF